jgi:hypothetical protein
MSTHRLNLWPWAFVLCVLTGYAAMAHLDGQPGDFDTLAQQDQRDWLQAVQFCHRAFGPQTAPEYDHNDKLVCVGKRGQRHIEVAIKPADLKVAAK